MLLFVKHFNEISEKVEHQFSKSSYRQYQGLNPMIANTGLQALAF